MHQKFMQFWDGLDSATLDILGEESDEMIDLLFMAHYATRAKHLKPIKFSNLEGAQELFHFLRCHVPNASFPLGDVSVLEKLQMEIFGHPKLKERIEQLLQKRSISLDKPDSKEGLKDPPAFLLYGPRHSGKKTLAKAIASLFKPDRVEPIEFKDVESWIASIPQIAPEGQTKLTAFLKEKGVNNLDYLKSFNIDQLETSQLDTRVKKKALVELSKFQYSCKPSRSNLTLLISYRFGRNCKIQLGC
jgi:hypothetical protein